MSDFWTFSPDFPTLTTVAKNLPKFWVPDVTDQQGNLIPAHMPEQWSTANGSVAWHYWGVWRVPTGATTKDAFGNDQPVMAPKPGVYGVLRINDDLAAVNLPAQVTVTRTAASGNTPESIVLSTPLGVTFTSPLPADAPVRF